MLMFYVTNSGNVREDRICATPTETWLGRLKGEVAILIHDSGQISYYLRTGESWGEATYKSVSVKMTDDVNDRACRFLDAGWTQSDIETLVTKLDDKFIDHQLPNVFAEWSQAVS